MKIYVYFDPQSQRRNHLLFLPTVVPVTSGAPEELEWVGMRPAGSPHVLPILVPGETSTRYQYPGDGHKILVDSAGGPSGSVHANFGGETLSGDLYVRIHVSNGQPDPGQAQVMGDSTIRNKGGGSRTLLQLGLIAIVSLGIGLALGFVFHSSMVHGG
jgi:hypothetical protein